MRTELHFHLLPGVDDGPRDDGEAIALARLAVADGTGRVIATPHAGYLDVAELPGRVQALQLALNAAGVPLEVRGGAEISVRDVPRLSHEELDAVAHGPAGARWLLLEAPLDRHRSDLELAPAAAELREHGFGLVIAHPERSRSTSLEVLAAEVRDGAVLQINASSLAGAHGTEAQEAAFDLVRTQFPYIIASDAHSVSRPPLLSRAAQALRAFGVPAATVSAAVDTRPEQLLTDGLPSGRVLASGRVRARAAAFAGGRRG